MDNYTIVIKNSAKVDLKKIKQSKLKPRFLEIIHTLKINPFYPNQSFEKLHPYQLNMYSRRLNHQHRVVYTTDESNKIVYIISAWSHYN